MHNDDASVDVDEDDVNFDLGEAGEGGNQGEVNPGPDGIRSEVFTVDLD